MRAEPRVHPGQGRGGHAAVDRGRVACGRGAAGSGEGGLGVNIDGGGHLDGGVLKYYHHDDGYGNT